MPKDPWFGKVPEGIVTKCPKCSAMLLCSDWAKNLQVCIKCDHHFRVSAPDRIQQLLDAGSFEEYDSGITSVDPLGFPEYQDKLAREKGRTGMESAVMTGHGTIDGIPTAVAITDSRFLMGSMDSAVGEKIARAIENATAAGMPVITVSSTGGGARMHEGILSLMQMAKTSASLARHNAAGLLHISVLADPSMAGVLASWASLGDVIIAEPKAMIGLAGLRVSKQAQVLKIPKDFQTSEFLLRHGMIDIISHRRDLRNTIVHILSALRRPEPTALATKQDTAAASPAAADK